MDMPLRSIGSVPVSLAGLGCNNFGRRIDEEPSRAVVHAALDAGVILFDTADIYGDGRSEEFLGRALGARRDEVVIVTKVGMREPPPGIMPADPDWVKRCCEDSLRRLGTDRIDVYLLHEPDPRTPVEETLGAMAELVAAGKVREIGCSNFDGAQIDEAVAAAEGRGVRGFVTVQNEYSLLERAPRDEVIPACERHGWSLMPYFPLAMGMLTGKYLPGEAPPPGTRLARDPASLDDERLRKVQRLAAFAEERGHTLLELALSWLANQTIVATVMAGATTPEQVRANAAATTAWPIGDDDLASLAAL